MEQQTKAPNLFTFLEKYSSGKIMVSNVYDAWDFLYKRIALQSNIPNKDVLLFPFSDVYALQNQLRMVLKKSPTGIINSMEELKTLFNDVYSEWLNSKFTSSSLSNNDIFGNFLMYANNPYESTIFDNESKIHSTWGTISSVIKIITFEKKNVEQRTRKIQQENVDLARRLERFAKISAVQEDFARKLHLFETDRQIRDV